MAFFNSLEGTAVSQKSTNIEHIRRFYIVFCLMQSGITKLYVSKYFCLLKVLLMYNVRVKE